jgi:hypothetical protein
VTVTVNGSAAPAVKVTVPVRGVVASFAATLKVAELPDDEAGETESQDSKETADHSPWFVEMVTPLVKARYPASKVLSETEMCGAPT